MQRASYRAGVDWIAQNDENGEDTPDNPQAEENVATYITTALMADLFGVTVERIAKDVMRRRKQLDDEEEKPPWPQPRSGPVVMHPLPHEVAEDVPGGGLSYPAYGPEPANKDVPRQT